MVCTTESNSRGTPYSVDVITCRYNDELVYVPLALARDYYKVLSHARDAFQELRGLPDSSISLSLTLPGQARKFVAISALAWPKLIAYLKCYQITDVHAKRMRTTVVSIRDREPAPPYPGGGSEPAPSAISVGDKKVSYPGERQHGSTPLGVDPAPILMVLSKALQTAVWDSTSG